MIADANYLLSEEVSKENSFKNTKWCPILSEFSRLAASTSACSKNPLITISSCSFGSLLIHDLKVSERTWMHAVFSINKSCSAHRIKKYKGGLPVL